MPRENAGRPQEANNNNRGRRHPVINVGHGLFRELFVRLALAYARSVPSGVRRLLEFALLVMAMLSFSMLVYIHLVFSRSPSTCLEGVRNTWPRDGILRVEIARNYAEKEEDASMASPQEQRREINDENDSAYISIPTFDLSSESQEMNVNSSVDEKNDIMLHIGDDGQPEIQIISPMPPDKLTAEENFTTSGTSEENVDNEKHPFKETVSVLNKLAKTVWRTDKHIIEYSLEYGFLRLGSTTRLKLNIPVLVVTLDPSKEDCFGDPFAQFVLEYVVGYDDVLVGSIKSLAEQEEYRGYLRNVVTGEQYRFVSLWMAPTSYLAAAFFMVMFTFSISMLLRYCLHQTFLSIDVLRMFELNENLTFPIAPLLTVILALSGMEAILFEFFNDATTVCCIVLIVWMADYYDAICCRTNVSRRHWLRFFYLYHFGFYAYHYRFSGQHSGLALFTSWLFIQHSMLYFFHHYELPVILRRIFAQRLVARVRRRLVQIRSLSTDERAQQRNNEGVGSGALRTEPREDDMLAEALEEDTEDASNY